MMTSLELDLDLLPGKCGGLSPDDRVKIQTFVDRPDLYTWVDAANVIVATDGRNPLTLCAKLMATYRHYHQGNAYFKIETFDGPSMWHRAPDPEHVVRTIKAITKTDDLPSIELELDLGRSSQNKLSAEERRALERLYFRPSVEHLVAAKDIVLLEDGNPDGGDLTFIGALALISPEWMAESIGEAARGDRSVKVFKRAPTWQLTHAALVRATH